MGVGSGSPSSATISRGFCEAEFPWEHVRFHTGRRWGLGSPHTQDCRAVPSGASPGAADAFWPPALTNLKSGYWQICFFFLFSFFLI